MISCGHEGAYVVKIDAQDFEAARLSKGRWINSHWNEAVNSTLSPIAATIGGFAFTVCRQCAIEEQEKEIQAWEAER